MVKVVVQCLTSRRFLPISLVAHYGGTINLNFFKTKKAGVSPKQYIANRHAYIVHLLALITSLQSNFAYQGFVEGEGIEPSRRLICLRLH